MCQEFREGSVACFMTMTARRNLAVIALQKEHHVEHRSSQFVVVTNFIVHGRARSGQIIVSLCG